MIHKTILGIKGKHRDIVSYKITDVVSEDYARILIATITLKIRITVTYTHMQICSTCSWAENAGYYQGNCCITAE